MLSAPIRDDADWAARGHCVGTGDAMFPHGPEAQRAAARRCADCPVTAQCLAFALEQRIDFGVWGGRTENERRAIQRRLAASRS